MSEQEKDEQLFYLREMYNEATEIGAKTVGIIRDLSQLRGIIMALEEYDGLATD